MIESFLDLWPKLRRDTLSPEQVLCRQAVLLAGHTGGRLAAEVVTAHLPHEVILHRFEVFAACEPVRPRSCLLTAAHRTNYFPVQIDADCYRPKAGDAGRATPLVWPAGSDWRRAAYRLADFVAAVREVLHSAEACAVVESLLTRADEAAAPRDTTTDTPTDFVYHLSDSRKLALSAALMVG